jgi:hypothetical protein
MGIKLLINKLLFCRPFTFFVVLVMILVGGCARVVWVWVFVPGGVRGVPVCVARGLTGWCLQYRYIPTPFLLYENVPEWSIQ